MIDEALFAHLTGAPGVSALIGTQAFPQEAPENVTPPWIVFFQVAAGTEETQALGGPVTVFRTLQQIDIYGRTKVQANAIAAAIRTAIGFVNNETWGEMTIKSSRFDDQRDGNFDSAANLHRIIQQYRIVAA